MTFWALLKSATIITVATAAFVPAGAQASPGDHKCKPAKAMTKSLVAGAKTRCSTARKVERHLMSARPTYLVRIDSISFTCEATASGRVTVCTGRPEGGRRKVVLKV